MTPSSLAPIETRSNNVQLPDGTVVRRYRILSSATVVYKAWRRGGFDDATTTTHIGDEQYYEVGTEVIPTAVREMPYGADRSALVDAWWDERNAEALACIGAAFPEVRNGGEAYGHEYSVNNLELTWLVEALFKPEWQGSVWTPVIVPAVVPQVDFDALQVGLQAAMFGAATAYLQARGVLPAHFDLSGDSSRPGGRALADRLADELYTGLEIKARRALKVLDDAGQCKVLRWGRPIKW